MSVLIYPGQSWVKKNVSGAPVRVSVVTAEQVGFTLNDERGSVKYLPRARFCAIYQQVKRRRP